MIKAKIKKGTDYSFSAPCRGSLKTLLSLFKKNLVLKLKTDKADKIESIKKNCKSEVTFIFAKQLRYLLHKIKVFKRNYRRLFRHFKNYFLAEVGFRSTSSPQASTSSPPPDQ